MNSLASIDDDDEDDEVCGGSEASEPAASSRTWRGMHFVDILIYGILLSRFRSDSAPQASHGALSRRPRCSTHTHCLFACCCTGARVVPTCCLTPLQANVTNVLELQATMSSRDGTFG